MEISAALGGGGGAALEVALDRARDRVAAGDLEVVAVEEALLQSYLFVGFPGVLEAFSAWRERMPAASDGSGSGAPPGEAGEARHEERGRRVCRSVYGAAYERLRANVRRMHPDLDRWMIREGYGKVLGRPGLELAVRELCIVALLAAAGRGPQLHSHLRGALRNGAGAERTRKALDAGLARVREPGRRRELEALWDRVLRSARRDGDV
jgi:4-carboxymuconolactone decarboxylase